MNILRFSKFDNIENQKKSPLRGLWALAKRRFFSPDDV